MSGEIIGDQPRGLVLAMRRGLDDEIQLHCPKGMACFDACCKDTLTRTMSYAWKVYWGDVE